MPNGAIVFDHVWKKFHRGERHDSLKDFIPSLIRGVLKRGGPERLADREFWAVQDLSFEVKAGEALGVIGPNGAGKSTTLKLLTRILRPTRGHCHITGRAAALIEVAAGFHPDLTGRENIFLQGAILGMGKADVARRFDAIVDFAGVSEFIDTPVKRYSSGMNARLGFAIAVHLEPDALVIDEVLSVGDMQFQQRCLTKMREFKRSGVAIIFVSHNLQAVRSLCDRAIHLNRGVVAEGAAPAVIDEYVKSRVEVVSRPPTGPASIRSVRLTDLSGDRVEQVDPGATLVLHVDYSLEPTLSDLTFSLSLSRWGHFSFADVGIEWPPVRSDGGPVEVSIAYQFQANVPSDQYYFGCGILENATQTPLDRVVPAAPLSVHEDPKWGGVAHLNVHPTARSLVPVAGR